MTYLICQIFWCLLIAALLGFLFGWWWRSRRSDRVEAEQADRIARLTRDLADCRAARNKSAAAGGRDDGADKATIARLEAEIASLKAGGQSSASTRVKRTPTVPPRIASTPQSKPAAKAKPKAKSAAKPKKPPSRPSKAAKPAADTVDLSAPTTDDDRPATLMRKPPSKPDDLKLIKGIGPKLETMLNDLGVYQYAQIAGFSKREVAWVNDNLTAFKGRIVRDQWVAQAKKLTKTK